MKLYCRRVSKHQGPLLVCYDTLQSTGCA
uniref:Uncharacterized protein n=1 Tax=Lepeophtheirus salmonis TaxID=72036 RepID=A0A0K2T500_LEPSM